MRSGTQIIITCVPGICVTILLTFCSFDEEDKVTNMGCVSFFVAGSVSITDSFYVQLKNRCPLLMSHAIQLLSRTGT